MRGGTRPALGMRATGTRGDDGTVSDGHAFPPPVPPVLPPAPPGPPAAPTGTLGHAPVVPPTGAPLPPPGAYGPPTGAPLPPPASTGGAGWVPPPKPGLVPLRPMTLGTILSGSFRVLRRNPGPTLGPSLIINLGILLFVAVATGLIAWWAIARVESAATQEDADALAAGSIAFGAIGLLLVMLLSMVGTSVLQGIIIAEVARGTLGERLRLVEIWQYLRGRIGALLGWGLLLAAAIGIASLIGFGLILGVIALIAFAAEGGGGNAVAVAVGAVAAFFIGTLVALVPLAFLWTKLAFVPATIVLERRPVFASIARSWRLVRGRFWRVFGIMLLVMVIINVAAQIVVTPISFLGGMALGLMTPNGMNDESALVATVVIYLGSYAVGTIVAAIGLVIQSATSGLLYIDARMRSEGLDLELARHVEQRQAGYPVDDPYLAPAAARA